MILDRLENGFRYRAIPARDEVLAFLGTLDERSPEQEHLLRGRDCYARVFGYDTLTREKALLEAHRDYIDVQMLLAGTERIGWYPQTGLTVTTPYDPVRDAEFYAAGEEPGAWLTMAPGIFAVFFPCDAHLTQVMTGDRPQPVKKVVVKIRRTLEGS